MKVTFVRSGVNVTIVHLSEIFELRHRPVIVKRAVLGSKRGWKHSTKFNSKVFRDWSILKLRERNHIIRRENICCNITAFVVVWLRKKELAFWYFFNEIFLSFRVPTFRGQKW